MGKTFCLKCIYVKYEYLLNLINGSTLNSDHIAIYVCVDLECEFLEGISIHDVNKTFLDSNDIIYNIFKSNQFAFHV